MEQIAESGSYIPSEVHMIIDHPIAGGFVLGGYADDTFITVDRENPTWEKATGTHGTFQRTHRLDKTFNITVSLMQISQYNDALSAIVKYDERVKSDDGMFTCILIDKSGRGGTKLQSTRAFLESPQNMEFSSSASNRDWVFCLTQTDWDVRGTVKLSQKTAEILTSLGYPPDASELA